jgi:hypothetical protein
LRFDGNGRFETGGAVFLETFEVGADVGGALEAEFAILFDGFLDDAIELGGNGRILLNGRRGLGVENFIEDAAGGFGSEWQDACAIS